MFSATWLRSRVLALTALMMEPCSFFIPHHNALNAFVFNNATMKWACMEEEGAEEEEEEEGAEVEEVEEEEEEARVLTPTLRAAKMASSSSSSSSNAFVASTDLSTKLSTDLCDDHGMMASSLWTKELSLRVPLTMFNRALAKEWSISNSDSDGGPIKSITEEEGGRRRKKEEEL